ncbi:DUF4416 family protein [Planctomycetota bacterium]
MWQLKSPQPVKLIVGLLGASEACLSEAVFALTQVFGRVDLTSESWLFEYTRYYRQEIGDKIFRQFVSFDKLIHPGDLAGIKHETNRIEQELVKNLGLPVPRPANLDPGYIEPSKLVLASTKNFAHRIYIGEQMYAEVTLLFDKGAWTPLLYTYPDYRQDSYFAFFSRVRERLREQHRMEANQSA